MLLGGDTGWLCWQRCRWPGGLSLPDGPWSHALPSALLPPSPPAEGWLHQNLISVHWNRPIVITELLPIWFHCWLQIEKYTMHISRFDDLLSRLSPQERQFAKRYILTGTGICHNYLCQLVKLVGSDGNQLLVFHLAQVVRRSWRSIWSSLCCQNCHMVMTRLPGSRSRALKMWV